MPASSESSAPVPTGAWDDRPRLSPVVAESEHPFRLAFAQAHVGMLLVSVEEAKNLDVNPAYCELLGYSRREVLEADPYLHWLATTHREDIERERVALLRVAGGEDTGYRMPKHFVRKDGELRSGEVIVAAAHDRRGRIKHLIVQVLDMEERRLADEARARLEDQLRRAQKLDSLGRLVGGVAHDLNNRLVVILGHMELLKRHAEGNPRLELHADAVLTSAQRAADLTRRLLAYGRRQILRPRACDLNAVVDGMRRMLERVIGETIELSTVLGAREPMLADPGQIEQVVMNLVWNARDAMPDGGRVTIETRDALVEAGSGPPDLAPGGYVVLTVADTGMGISEDVRSQIFEPFFTTKDVGKGTGLGLAVSDGIVRQTGGGIGVESTPGQGSAFTVYLPRAVEPEPRVAEVTREASANRGAFETVLVVDDEDDVRRALVDVLELASYRLLEARDGHHALELLASHAGSIDLLVTDLAMPGLSGVELADRLRVADAELPVLFITGYAEAGHMRELCAGEHLLQKPFQPSEFLLRVRAILDGGEGRARAIPAP